MHARSALFDLYGDHLRARGGRAPVAALVRLLASLGVSSPAVRTAISRMVRQGWLAPAEVAGGRGYELTDRAHQRLDDAAARIYRTRKGRWKGAWDLWVLDPVSHRSARERVRSGLSFLGYAQLADDTWVSPWTSSEVAGLLAAEGATGHRFEAHDAEAERLARRAWDLEGLGAAYAAWHGEARRLVFSPEVVTEARHHGGPEDPQPGPVPDDERAFVVRSLLVHEWRKFLFRDPGLPAELLPADWPGHSAARFFDEEAARLQPAAARFVDRCLDPSESGDPR